MGLITWIIIGVVIIAIIGLGVGTFVSGVWTGAQKVGNNPLVNNVTQTAKDYIANSTKNLTSQLVEKAPEK